jgi:hypothetical protein
MKKVQFQMWIWIAPLVLLISGCSRTTTQAAVTPQPQPAAANPEPVAPPLAAAPAAPTSAPAAEAVPEPAPTANAETSAQPARPVRELLVPRGTAVRVRIDQEVDTRHNRPGDHFTATLYEPVEVNGVTVLPPGTRFRGHLVTAKSSGRMKGRAVLGLTLDSFSHSGRTFPIETSGAYRESKAHKRRNLAIIGGGAGGGAAIGALAGGGLGAGIGALAGGGAGVAGAAITGKKQVAVAAETPLTFTLRHPVRM